MWDRFWFQPIPTHSYALLRILFGALGCATLIELRDLDTFWAIDGLVLPQGTGLWLRRVFLTTGLEHVGPQILYFGCLTAFAAMTIGYRTGTAVTMSLVASLLQVSWNYLPLSGADTVMRGILFCLIWADCGSVWSVDAWLQRRRGTDESSRTIATYPIAPLRLIRFQLALIYLSSGLWKLYSPLWRDGSALHYVLNNNQFQRFPFSVPPDWEWALTVGTYLTLFWELAFAFCLPFTWTRRAVLVIGVLVHIGMIVAIEIGPFSYVMLSGYVAFLDPSFVATLSSRIRPLLGRTAPTIS